MRGRLPSRTQAELRAALGLAIERTHHMIHEANSNEWIPVSPLDSPPGCAPRLVVAERQVAEPRLFIHRS